MSSQWCGVPLNLCSFLYVQAKCLDFSLVVVYLALLCAFLLWGLLYRTRGRTAFPLKTKPLGNSDDKSDSNKNGKSPHNSVQVLFCQIIFMSKAACLTRILFVCFLNVLVLSIDMDFQFLLACFSSPFLWRKCWHNYSSFFYQVSVQFLFPGSWLCFWWIYLGIRCLKLHPLLSNHPILLLFKLTCQFSLGWIPSSIVPKRLLFEVFRPILIFEKYCRKHGIFVARYPLLVLCVSLLIPVLLCIGLLRFKVETRPEKVLNLFQSLLISLLFLVARPIVAEMLRIQCRDL